MAITPLFTIDELNAQIAAWKQALLDCSSGQTARINTPGGERLLTLADLPEIRNTLTFLQGERASLELGSRPQIIPGRPVR